MITESARTGCRALRIRAATGRGSARASTMAVMHAGVVQVDRGGVGAVVGGEHDRLPADCDAVAVQEGAAPWRA